MFSSDETVLMAHHFSDPLASFDHVELTIVIDSRQIHSTVYPWESFDGRGQVRREAGNPGISHVYLSI